MDDTVPWVLKMNGFKIITPAYIQEDRVVPIHRNASFSSSVRTSFWLLSLATSIGVFPSKFWRVLHRGNKNQVNRITSTKKEKKQETRGSKDHDITMHKESRLTQLLHSLTTVLHTLFFHNQQHSAGQYSYSCSKHQPLPLLQEAPEHTSPV